MAGTVDDWYLDRSHLGELDARYSPDDDVPDPYVFGEAPPRRPTVPRSTRSRRRARPAENPHEPPPATSRGSWRSAAEKWLAKHPQRSNDDCFRALRLAGHTDVTRKLVKRLRANLPKAVPARPSKPAGGGRSAGGAEKAGRSTSSGRHRGVESSAPWHSFARRWLRKHPNASNRQWQEAIEEAGFAGVTDRAISALRREIVPVRAVSRPRPVRRPTPQPARAPGVDYCGGCGIAVSDDGLCRC